MVVTSARFRPAASAVGESLAAGGHAKEPAGIGYLLVMAEIVYPPVMATARTLFRVLDYRFHLEGTEHVPRSGGAVLVSNHISYLDFIFAGFGALPAKRLVRFMAKKDVFDHRISGPLMRGMHHIPVDREAGAGSYATALRMLKAGEVVGVFAEAHDQPLVHRQGDQERRHPDGAGGQGADHPGRRCGAASGSGPRAGRSSSCSAMCR